MKNLNFPNNQITKQFIDINAEPTGIYLQK